MAAPDLSGYIEVAERERLFFEKYPDGSLQASLPRIIELDGKRYLEVAVSAYRQPNDPRPGIGTAWEVWPGRTPYTRDSEMMNAETSAIGRALACLGIGIKSGHASRDEVRNRVEDRAAAGPDEVPIPKRLTEFRKGLNRHGVRRQEDQLQVVGLVLSREVPDFKSLGPEELDRLEPLIADLDAERARIEDDEEGGRRVVRTEEAPDDGSGY